ncbi:MAG TPA: TadE family protein, partial [Candidatus Limnocylindrales bacterium]
MLILLAAAIDLGRLFYSYVAVENAAKEGAFFGSRNPLCDDVKPGCADPDNVVWHARNEAPNIGTQFTTTVACRDSATDALIQPINNCLDGSKYQVTVTYPFQLVTPILSTILGNALTLHSEAQATVVNDAFDPSGLEVLVWVYTANSENGAAITSACTPADAASSPGFYYQPCQDSSNVDNYLTFQENAP